MRSVVGVIAAGALCVGCATTGNVTEAQLSATPEPSAAASPQPPKQSLDKMLDEHDRVELVDDETGKTKLICKRQPVLGSRLGSHKVCATRKQWEDQKHESEENVDHIQRGLAIPPPSGN